MKNIMQIGLIFSTIFTLCACEPDEIIEKSDYNASTRHSEKIVDPIIEKFSAFGRVTQAPDSYRGSSLSCTSSLDIYLLIPDYGPYAGSTCEIYRYRSPTDVEGPCGEEYNLEWTEDEIGGYKTLACPEPGETCAELEGVNGCRLVHCDEPE